MKLVIRLVLLAAAVVLGFWLWTVFFPSPEKVIRKKMSALAETATFPAGANNIGRATKALAFIGYFSADAEIIVDVAGFGPHRFAGRDEIREAANGGFAALPGLKVSFLDTTVQVSPDRQTAEAACTLRVAIGNDKDFGVEELHLRWTHINDDWHITRAETVKTLK
jgi:hypothetical protein